MKKMYVLIVVILLLVPISIGCNKANKEDHISDKEAKGIIEKGISSLEIEDYEEAIGFFDIAIAEYPSASTRLAKQMAEKYIELKFNIEEIFINGNILIEYEMLEVEEFYIVENLNKNFNTFKKNYPEYSKLEIVSKLEEDIEEVNHMVVDSEIRMLFYMLSISEPDEAKEVLKEFVEEHEDYSSEEQLKLYDKIKKNIKSYSINGDAEIEHKYKLEDEVDNNEYNQENGKLVEEDQNNKNYDPYEWESGIKEAFEADMILREYINSAEEITYEKGYFNDLTNEGHYNVYIMIDGEKNRLVSVNCKTGDYHG